MREQQEQGRFLPETSCCGTDARADEEDSDSDGNANEDAIARGDSANLNSHALTGGDGGIPDSCNDSATGNTALLRALGVAHEREIWRQNAANYRARKRAAVEAALAESKATGVENVSADDAAAAVALQRERWRRNSANYQVRKRAAAEAALAESKATGVDNVSAEDATAAVTLQRESWRGYSATYKSNKRRKLPRAADVKSLNDGSSVEEQPRLGPVSKEIRDAAMARLRKALGPDMLDECVCLVCDRSVPRCEAVRIDDEKLWYVTKLRSSVGGVPDDLPGGLSGCYDCSELAPELIGMLLSRTAVRVFQDPYLRQRWWSMVCHVCDRSVMLGKVPKFAIANGFFVGRLPNQLDDLTLPERMMTQLATICSMTRVMRGGRHRCIRSHCVVFDATPGPPVSLLPRSVENLECFRVALVGDFTDAQISKVRKMHKIRRRIVFEVLQFYKDNNNLYSGITSTEAQNDESAAPTPEGTGGNEPITDLFFDVPDKDGNLEAEASRQQEDIRGMADNSHVEEQEEACVVERRTALLDDTTAMSISSMAYGKKKKSVGTTFRDFLVKRSTHFSDEDTQTLFGKMFPHLFPFGRGHPGEKRRVSVSLKECVKYYTLLSSRRFAEDELFVLVAFDRIAMQNMYTQTSFRCRRFPHLFQDYDTIDTSALAKVLLDNERRRQGCRVPRSDDNAMVDQFLKTVDIASCAVWGSNAERAQCRRQAFAYQTRFGQPALFLTLTPNTDNSLLMAHYAGATSVQSAFDLLDSKLPTKAELRNASMGNDCISTQLFIRSVDAFIKHALGIDPKTKQPMKFRGLFGDVRAYFGMVETQGRGTLHVHFLIWLAGCPRNSIQVESMLSGPNGDEFCESVKAYSSSIVSNDLPLPLEDGKCCHCGASYTNLVGLKINPNSRKDPCAGLYNTEARSRVMEPCLVECSVCKSQFSSQHVLRQLVLEKRMLMPAWDRPLSTKEVESQAGVEADSRNSMEEAFRIVDERERYHGIIHPKGVLETSNMTTAEISDFLLANNLPSMPYCKEDQDLFQNDAITRRIELTPPSPLDGRMSPSTLAYMVSVLVVRLNQHWWGHTGSCFKASRATNNDSYCRYLFPRERVKLASFKPSGVELPRKLAHDFINGYNFAVMATFKCNHDVQILLGGTEALDRIYYACKYVTKQQKRLDSVIPIAVAALKRRQGKEIVEKKAESNALEDRIARSRKRVTSMVYSMTNRQEVAGPLAALYLNIGTCCYSSRNCCKLPLGDMIRQICAEGDYLCQLVVDPGRSGATSSTATAVSVLDDYIFRAKELEKLCVYEFVMKYFRKQSSEPRLTRFPFQNGHPLSKTHCLGVRDSEYIPMISGYRVPGIVSESTEDDRLKHAIGALVLFKSFRSLTDLTGAPNPTAITWTNVYNEWEGQRSAFVIEIMGNMHDFSFGRSKAAAAAVSHQFGRTTEDVQSTGSDSDDSDDETFFDDDHFDSTGSDGVSLNNIWDWDFDDESEDILDSSKLHPAICPSCSVGSGHTQNVVAAFADCRILDPVASRTARLISELL